MNRISQWNYYYSLLKKYEEEYGNVDVPIKYEINKIKLGKWVHTQREAYKGNNRCKMTNKNIKLLNDIDFDWNIKTTIALNKKITDMEIYNTKLFERMNFVLRDLNNENINEILSIEDQKEIEKIIIKRVFR